MKIELHDLIESFTNHVESVLKENNVVVFERNKLINSKPIRDALIRDEYQERKKGGEKQYDIFFDLSEKYGIGYDHIRFIIYPKHK